MNDYDKRVREVDGAAQLLFAKTASLHDEVKVVVGECMRLTVDAERGSSAKLKKEVERLQCELSAAKKLLYDANNRAVEIGEEMRAAVDIFLRFIERAAIAVVAAHVLYWALWGIFS